MATDGRRKAIVDISLLLTFLRIDRVDLLASHVSYRFIVIDSVKQAARERGQARRLETALLSGDLIPDGPPSSIGLKELAAFAAMSSLKIGNGDKAVIAAAKVRGLALAMDDERVWKMASAFCKGTPREDTASIILSHIRAGLLTIAEADAIKADRKAILSFAKKNFTSFGELI